MYNAIMKLLQSINNSWFYSKPHFLLRLLTVYVKGDMILIIPILIAIGCIGLFSLRFMCLMYAVFYTLRGFGEMIYWFSHQFWDKKFRPDDFGFINLDNNAIYIKYQLMSMATVLIGVAVIFYILLYWY